MTSTSYGKPYAGNLHARFDEEDFRIERIKMERSTPQMKKQICMFLTATMAVLCAQSDTWTDPDTGYTWTYQINGDTAEVYNGGSVAISPSPFGTVTIPSALGGKPVTSIGTSAFSGCSGLLSVTIPNSVTNIEEGVLYGCDNLKNLTIPYVDKYDRFPTRYRIWQDWDMYMHLKYTAFTNRCGLGKLFIKATIASEVNEEYWWHGGTDRIQATTYEFVGEIPTTLTEVVVTSGKAIGEKAFAGCSSLKRVVVPEGTAVAVDAFDGCVGLEGDGDGFIIVGDVLVRYNGGEDDVRIPGRVHAIGSCAFENCVGLRNVVIPENVTNICGAIFHGCTELESLTLPSTREKSQLKTAYEVVEGEYWEDDEVLYTYSECSGLASLFVKATGSDQEIRRRVNGYEWYDVDTIYSLDGSVPSTLKIITVIGGERIDAGAFMDCVGVETLDLPDSLSCIGEEAFGGCTGLKSVMIPERVTNICASAFAGSGVTSFSISEGNPSYKVVAGFLLAADGRTLVQGIDTDADLPADITSIGDYAFAGRGNLTSFTVPYSVTGIGKYAFSDCKNLMTVTLGNSVTNVAEHAFSGCCGLTNVKMPDNIKNIGRYAFSDCTGLASVPIGNGVTCVGEYAFSGCSGLTNVMIPDGVTDIEYGAFYDCDGLKSATIPSSVTNIKYSVFEGCEHIEYVEVPFVPEGGMSKAGLLSFFGGWGWYGTWGEVPMSLRTVVVSGGGIGAEAFSGCSGLTSVMICDDVTNIGNSAFANCVGLRVVLMPERFKYALDSSVFSNCPDDMYVYYYPPSKCPVPELIEVFYDRLSTVAEGAINIEVVVTNACRVSFDWKCSCEPLRKGKMCDYLSFSIDDVQKDAICGDVAWTNMAYVVDGDGEHVLRWTYQKDDSTDEGEDCGWIRLVTVAPWVTLSFLPGEAMAGEPPEAMTFYADGGTVSLPGCGTLAFPKHSFAGWSDGGSVYAAGEGYPCSAEVLGLTAVWSRNELAAPVIVAPEEFLVGDTAPVDISAEGGAEIRYTLDGSKPTTGSPLYAGPIEVTDTTTIRAVAVRDDYFDSPEATFTVTMDPTTLGDAVNAPALEFSTDAESGWRRVKGESPDGYALRSGVIGNNATSRIDTVVVGEGVITFSCKVAGEVIKGEVYDGLAFLVDGVQQGGLMGNANWTTNMFEVAGDGVHTLSWCYVKDESDEDVMPEDCTWLDEVWWTSSRTVTVVFDANGGELDAAEASRRVLVCAAIGDLPIPARTDYTFLGWFTAATGGEKATADHEVAEDMTLYAHWARVVRTVSFDTNGGGVAPADAQVESGEAIGNLPVVSRHNYMFLGWFTAATGGEQVVADTAIGADMTLYAHWQCRFSFNGGGVWTEQLDGSWKSGVTADDSTNSVSMAVSGSGTVSFKWKVSCEDYFVFRTQKILCDHLLFLVDGESQDLINGETDWTNATFTVEGAGEHVLSWAYVKDSEGSEGSDCAWLDEVTWVPSAEAWLAERNLTAETKAANGRTAAECYALGLDPALATNDFRIVSIELVDGQPKVEWEPKTNRWTGVEIPVVLKGAERLEGPWNEVPTGGDSPGTARPTMRFFKVVVEVP